MKQLTFPLLTLILFFLISRANAQDKQYEKHYCTEEPFCNRNMYWETQAPIYYIDPTSLIQNNNAITAKLKNFNSDYIKNAHELLLTVFIMKSGIFRIKIKEVNSNRFEFQDRDLTFEMEKEAKLDGNIKISSLSDELIIYYFEEELKKRTKYELNISYSPFGIVYKMDNKNICQMNSRNLFDMEFPSNPNDINENDASSAIKMDISLAESLFLTGLPERSSLVSLVDTNTSDLYHFYNVDIFKFPFRTYVGLYGFIPFIMSHSHGGEVVSGFIWNNPSETYVAIQTTNEGKDVLWISETGIFDFSFWADSSIDNFYSKYHNYIGPTPIPPIYALGYHQSRYSYKTLQEIQKVDELFDKYDIPYDTIWFDIDHTDDKRYFTWNNNYQGLQEFLNQYEKKGRQVVLIIDPHIKVDKWYFVYYDAFKQNYFIKYKGENFVGNCWSKESSYLDFYDQEVRDYWKKLILETDSYFTQSNIINIWNDMNEPSVFDVPRYTIPKTAQITYNKTQYQHREAHNFYGYLMHKTTYESMEEKHNKRAFVLTRSFYLGSHKFGAMWTGDPKSSYEDLELSVPMLLSLSISGYSFIGADVGGFCNNSTPDLYSRWYLLGTFYPFFRGHSHSETYRREPWLFNKDVYEVIKSSIITRYRILPYIYTEFYHHYKTGMPIMRPIWFKYENKLTLDQYANVEFFFGSSLLIRPVLTRQENDLNSIQTYLPEAERWFDFYSYNEIFEKGEIEYQISQMTIGVFIKGGRIIPTKERLRRSSKMMKNDPVTLIVALDNNDQASGDIYFDDGYSFAYSSGKQSLYSITYNNGHLSVNAQNSYEVTNVIEKIIIVGIRDIESVSSITLFKDSIKRNIEYKVIEKHIELIRLKLEINSNWDISVNFVK